MESKFSSIKDRLAREAAKITQSDVDKLRNSVPKKLKDVDLTQLKEGVSWLGTLLERARLLVSMVLDKDFSMEWKTKAYIAAGLIYFVMPVDIIPDFIPGLGYIDDAFVLSTVWKTVSGEVERYRTALNEREPARASLQRV